MATVGVKGLKGYVYQYCCATPVATYPNRKLSAPSTGAQESKIVLVAKPLLTFNMLT